MAGIKERGGFRAAMANWEARPRMRMNMTMVVRDGD